MMDNYGILGWIVIGLLAGGIAKLLMPGRDPGGCIITILLGIAGSMLFGLKPYDPLTLLAAAALLALITVGASLVPARRATRLDPMVALRQD